ncbi:MAG TPA: hypothetical protein VMJ10_07725, partial [Kofleriaceae bacterium]|nr:hypothetical protein [Kofleriaceae bacterium]
GQILRVRRVLSSRGLLYKLPDRLEATLEGRNVLVADLETIRQAYADSDYPTAIKLIEEDRDRILRDAANRDPIPALAELAQWRGIVAAASNDEDEAVRQFRAAYRFNPGLTLDKKLASPRVRTYFKKAQVEPEDRGVLKVAADPDSATYTVDGGEAKPVSQKMVLPVGIHLVMITAEGRKPWAELAEIRPSKPYKLEITLDAEDKVDRASKLVDEAVAAPAGKPRLKRTRALAKLTGVTRMLVVEEGDADHITMRLYDVEARKVSKPLEFDTDATSAVIARKVAAALEPDNLVDVDTVVVADKAAPAEPMHWYQHWYVWAGVLGVATAVGGGIAAYDYSHRAPTSIRGF